MAFGLSRAMRRRRQHPDEGFTIIEVVASLGIIAIAFAALTTVFWAGLRTAGVSSVRSRGVAVATRETEAIRAVPYAQIGYYADQPGYVATFEGAPTVTLGATTPGGVTPRLQPVGTLTVGPKTFTINRYITLVSAQTPSSTMANAYKKTSVVVTWTDDGGPHTIRQDSIVYPGGLGPLSTTTSTSTTIAVAAPNAPVLNSVTPPPAPAGESSLTVNWTPDAGGGPVDHFVVEYSTNGSFPVGSVTSSSPQPATATTFTATSLGSSTTYHFRVRAYGPTNLNAVSNTMSGLTLTPPAAVCSITSVSVTGSSSLSSTKTYLKNNGKMTENLFVTMSATSACNGTAFRVRSYLSTPTSLDPGAPWTPTPITGENRSAIVASDDVAWSVGLHTFEVINSTGSPLSPTVIKTFLVCAFDPHPSTSPNQC